VLLCANPQAEADRLLNSYNKLRKKSGTWKDSSSVDTWPTSENEAYATSYSSSNFGSSGKFGSYSSSKLGKASRKIESMDYSDDFYDYFNIDPVDIQSPTLSRLGMPGLSKPALTSDVPKLADDILPSRFTKKKGSSMKDNKKKKNKGTSKRKHKYPYKKRQQASKHPNSVEDNIAMAGSTTASTTSFNSKKGPSTVPVRRNGVKIGPATPTKLKRTSRPRPPRP